jgi:universal stress protein A
MDSMKIGDKIIVVAVDINSPREVVRRAAEVAEHIDAYVILVTVIDIPRIAGAEVSPLSTDMHEKRISEYHKSLIQEYFSGMPNILVESKILYGDPANEICKLAEDINADMVVIGSRDSKIESMLLGSVSEKVLKRCKCSVLMVKIR